MTHKRLFTEDSKMGKHVKYAIKCVTFVLLTGFLVGMVNTCLKPKYYYNQMWPSTNTYLDFYNLDKNSVDVLFLGSSHAMCTFNPQIIYDTYGITSYNLASEQQSLVVSYYWLREALKYQTPKVVVLDTYMLYKFGANYVYNDMNCSEGSVRKAMDGMRPSPLKWEAARTIAQIDPTQSALSYLFLNIRYHARWNNLNEDDFTESSMIEHGGVKGFTTTGGTAPSLHRSPRQMLQMLRQNPCSEPHRFISTRSQRYALTKVSASSSPTFPATALRSAIRPQRPMRMLMGCRITISTRLLSTLQLLTMPRKTFSLTRTTWVQKRFPAILGLYWQGSMVSLRELMRPMIRAALCIPMP